MVIRADIDRLAPSRSQARQLGLADAARENQFRQGLIQQGGKDLNQIADFMDRRDILNQLGAQQEQLGVQPVQQPQVDIETQTDSILESGGIVDEETEANFSSLAEKTEGASDADMQKEIINHAQKGLAEGRDMSDTIELAGKSPQEQRLAIGNINEMIKNKSVRRMMARNPKGAQSFLKGLGATGMDGGASKVQFGAQQTIKDSEGNLFTITQKRDPRTGNVETAYAPIGNAPSRPVGATEITGTYGLTSSGAVDFEGQKTKEQRRQASIEKNAENTYQQVNQINDSITTIDTALQAIDDGAQIGAFADFLPSFRASTKAFVNARNKMGLDVVASVTFGALSKGELDLAMSTAIPPGLNEEGAKDFLIKKKAAQIKLRDFYIDMADKSLSQGKTPAEIMIAESKNRKNKPKSTPKPQPASNKKASEMSTEDLLNGL